MPILEPDEFCPVCSKRDACANLCASLDSHLKDCEFSDGRLVFKNPSDLEMVARPRTAHDNACAKYLFVISCASLEKNNISPQHFDISTVFPFLTKLQQRYMILRFLNGLTVQEIGQIMGTSHQAVSRVINRALRQIRKRGGCKDAYIKGHFF